MGWIPSVMLMVLLAGPAQAEIYRGVDQQGRVHFGQRPQPGSEAVVVKPQVIERDVQMRRSEDTLRHIMQVRQSERDLEKAARLEQRRRQQSQCDRMGSELAQFDRRMYWYDEDVEGKKVEVDTRRVEERRAEIQAQIRERC
ncbi:MAG: DUF4124 domain-containing protein [Halopseudomonas sp.]